LPQPLPAGAEQLGSVVQPLPHASAGALHVTGAQHESGAPQLSQHGGLMSEHLRWYVYTLVWHGRAIVGLQQAG
jgi:hypothetical protein